MNTIESIATFKVQLVTIKDVEEFVQISSTCPKSTEILVKRGRFVIDGKSLMGLFSLNLSEPIDVEIKSTENSTVISNLLNQFNKWRVED
nr:MAG TPA: Catabolite control protein A [Caudoviricetes sp.]